MLPTMARDSATVSRPFLLPDGSVDVRAAARSWYPFSKSCYRDCADKKIDLLVLLGEPINQRSDYSDCEIHWFSPGETRVVGWAAWFVP